jgi:hypothetical protein
MKVATFGVVGNLTTFGIGVNHVVKVTRKDSDESILTLDNGTTVEVKGTVAQVIAILNA